jgi:FKBP-type peptidyl-prolyl cis-trans isomerase
LVAAGLAAGGCAEPDQIVTAAAPGQNVRASLAPKEEPAEARGEQPATAAKSEVLADLVSAPPTAKGETKTTPSGVTYETLKEGSGEVAKAGQQVTVHYVGTLEDGRKFDSSRDREGPAKFSIGTGAVIKGWDEAVPGMKVGELRKLSVPAVAGYGALGKPPTIPPNANLVFEIELIKIE